MGLTGIYYVLELFSAISFSTASFAKVPNVEPCLALAEYNFLGNLEWAPDLAITLPSE